MRTISWLQNATLQECLALNELIDPKIPRKSLALIKASLARNWNFDPFRVKFGTKDQYQMYKAGLAKSEHYSQAQKMLKDLNFPVFYLYPWFYLEALAIYYNENAMTVPLSLTKDPSYSFISIYFMPQTLREEYFYFIMTPLEYASINYNVSNLNK